MNILLIAKAYPPVTGGLETYSEQVALAYVRAGHAVTVITAHHGATDLEIRGGVRIFNVGMGRQINVFIRMLIVLSKLRRNTEFDFVHATSWRVALPAMVLLGSVKLLISVHGREIFVVSKWLQPLMRAVFKRADIVVAVSQPIADGLQAQLPFKLKYIGVAWNGISFAPPDRNWVEKSDPTHIFCMCRLVARKNLVRAVSAIATLHKEGLEFTFHIAGSGPEIDSINAVISQEGVDDKVKCLGRITDEEAIEEYSKAGIFLHPQIATEGGGDIEGFGIVIADAMVFGAVAVVGNSGGPKDFIQSWENGVLVEGREPVDISDALRTLLADVELQKKIAQRGLEFAREHFTWKQHIATIEDFVQKKNTN